MRDLPVGNGSLLVTFDERFHIRDVYFPRVGQENHTEGFPSRFGVWVDGQFSWVSDDSWDRTLKYLPETLVTDVHLVNEELGIEITAHDTVESRHNLFLRKCEISNLRDNDREVRIFFHHDFRINENKVGDTAFFDPETESLIHYKKNRYFLINTEPQFHSFTTGRKAFRDQEGTWLDAEDGELNGSAITEGSVDSVVRIDISVGAQQTSEIYYWIAAGENHEQVKELNAHMVSHGAAERLANVQNFWTVWVNKNNKDFLNLSDEIVELYKRSMLIIKTQTDNGGAILAANDSDVTERATDHYSYMWPRDGALVANALDLAGYPFLTRKFFNYCAEIVHENGYFLQKYNPDGTLASGWHAAWDVWARKKLIPIQEDETALVIWALWEHYSIYREIEFSKGLYDPLVKPCADFMSEFVDERLSLPKASWNLWEDRRGIHTFTASTVVGGLRAAANFARMFAHHGDAEKYESVADSIVEGIRENLFSTGNDHFFRALNSNDDVNFEPDSTLDASMFGLFYFGALEPDDDLVVKTMSKIEERLWVNQKIGGIARFENDPYMRVSDEFTGNAWVICTLWLAEWYTAKAKTLDDLGRTRELLDWVTKRALPSGVLAEQIDPHHGGPVSVSPLTWSHSTFVGAVENYRNKYRELSS